MGSTRALDGEISITPPIPLTEIPPACPHLPANNAAEMARHDLPQVGLVFRVETVGGAEVAIGLVPPVFYAYKHGAPKELEEIVAAYGPGRTFSGELTEYGDTWTSTISVADGKVIITPDEDEDEDDDDGGWDNTVRAEKAEPALQLFADTHSFHPADRDLTDPAAAEQTAQDLIGDLCHLLDRRGVNPGAVLLRAYSAYLMEGREDGAGEQPPTAHTAPCPDGAAGPGAPCPWACSCWGQPGAAHHRATI
ncbi:hypothetical protein GCM10017673_38760 [Streptosporangium violaceochromogenes]|nr:hypothetical protein GCM10017673_38760 [Streptosporangium violaceochromogenes]